MSRVLALGGLAGPLLFAAVTVCCAALRPDYSHLHHFISELGATGTSHAQLMNYAGFAPTGLLLMGFGVALAARLPRHRWTTVGASLVGLFGGGILLAGFFSCDVGCPQSGGSIANLVHDRIAPPTFLAGSLGAVCLGLRFRSLASLRALWVYSVVSGALGVAFLAGLASTLESREFTGLWQRLLLTALFAWCAVVSVRLALSGRIESPVERPPAP